MTTLSRRMLDDLARRLRTSPSERTADEIIRTYTKPWAEVYAYTRLASIADGMVDAWDELPFDVTPEEQEELILQVQQINLPPEDKELVLAEFEPQEQVLLRPWLGLPPPIPPSDLVLSDDGGELFNIRMPSYEWALRDLADRHLVTREQWDELEDEEVKQAFTVAGLETEGAIARVRDAIHNTLQEGWTLDEFKVAVGKNSFLSEAHAENVFRTNLHQAYSDGKMAVVESPFVADAFPYATIDPIGDDRVRAEHRALAKCGLNGTNVFRVDDPVFQTFRPPWDFSCRCGWGPLTVRQAANKGVSEAKQWLEFRTPPTDPEHVPWPSYNGKLILPNPRYRRAA
ncbi:MAG: hypothetical protein JNJ77_20030 [Planctomycetia bacterium]|nr:hypothetical protein [Planctomycetia bacterium]